MQITKIAVSASAVLVWVLATGSAPAADHDICRVEITSPLTGFRAGGEVMVTGHATISPGNALVAFARRKGLGVAWPQSGGRIVPDAHGDFSVLVTLGTPRDIGSEFDVFLEFLDNAQVAKVDAWFRQTESTGNYPGMPVPPFVAGCGVPVNVTVIKTT